MAVKFKDYYDTLGVSKTATADDIKKRYRKLARQHHPDVNRGDKNTEEKFKDLNEAYEVLSDPDKRKRYDQLGSDFQAGAEFTPPPGWEASRVDFGNFGDVFGGGGSSGFSDFFESLFGARSGVGRGPARRRRGQDIEAEIHVPLQEAHRGATHRIQIQTEEVCPECEGSGTKDGKTCPVCHGAGSIRRPKSFEVTIPPGVRDGSLIRLAGQGQPGTNGAPPGDLLLRIRIEPHPLFNVVGEDDIEVELPVAPWEAALGAPVTVPTLDGQVELKIPAGAQGDKRLRLRGQGLIRRDGGRGDEYVKLKIVIPPKLTAKEKELFRELADESRFNPRESMAVSSSYSAPMRDGSSSR
jgi:curved DNA-binding protein